MRVYIEKSHFKITFGPFIVNSSSVSSSRGMRNCNSVLDSFFGLGRRRGDRKKLGEEMFQ